MVYLAQIRISNRRIAEALPAGLVAVFVGATSGIGLTTMRQFAKHTRQPRVYFIGRSEEAAGRITAELQSLNPSGTYFYIPADISLLQTVDHVCFELKSRETSVNLLFLTPGTMLEKDTMESLHYPSALLYYSRVRFIVNLLPLLQKASSIRRVVTVFGAGKEGALEHDFQDRRIPSISTMKTLALENLALEAPEVSFVHSFPGFVKTNLGKDARTASAIALRAVFKVVGPMISLPVIEAGERQLFIATSARFPAREGGGVRLVEVGQGVSVSRGTDGREGSGVYSVSFDAEPASRKVEETLDLMRRQNKVQMLWLHTMYEFQRITGSAFV
ncbi:hypothetical protein QBC35DRAFT_455021 [Podospora australis]|uniref:Uncharacterized protein n=1 Tax=Podospora australis TaxID=1536484 RepID=A0AAN6WMB1_9PEZI|nr:hypothetical protein QBC35DRAFT_455021 [Podospora australis]